MNSQNPSRQARALLVDDDASTAPVYMQRLEGEGYQVTKTTDSTIALSVARQLSPDIIFIHLGKRGSGSSTFIQMLRSHDETRNIPITLLSKYYDRSLERLGLTAVEHVW